MYHVIGDPPAGAPYPGLFVRPTDFTSQLRWLARHGYQAVKLRDVWDHWHRGAPLPERPIVVSFDDGYRSVVHDALPQMRDRRWPGVLNLTVKNLRGLGGLSPRQV
jgi:peptidoglycan/xylan/chitin deacetylase (PgdA/CDA1 family)